MAGGLGGSAILKIAAQINAMQAEGRDICNLTVGDFSPAQFRVPAKLAEVVAQAYEDGNTNYPPAVGLPGTRRAVRDLYERRLGLNYPVDSVVMGSGARPPIFATYALVVQAGDKVLYGIPSWNNHYYCHINGGIVVGIETGADTDFLLDAKHLEGQLDGVALICLNSPLNPCGTAFSADALGSLCDVILAENERRKGRGERPVMVLYDQVYWMLCFGDVEHVTPPGVRPEMAAYTILVDAISKSFAATGLRVGWGVLPPGLTPAYKALIGHMGAWAPRPTQLATEALLDDEDAIDEYHAEMKSGVEARLNALHQGFEAMRQAGLPVRSLAPQGAIYLSARFSILGREVDGRALATDDDIRSYLLQEASFGLVPFQAFGLVQDTGWMRLSVGAVGLDEIEAGLKRIEAALQKLA
jgi:aspartate aminotransferase